MLVYPFWLGTRRQEDRMNPIIPALPFQTSDPAHKQFQYLEDLATAYWYSEVLFAALDLDLFSWIERGADRIDKLADAAGCRPEALARLLRVLKRTALVHAIDGRWVNSPQARMFLVVESADYMGDFFLYRRYMQPRWSLLAERVSLPDRPRQPPITSDADYRTRNEQYVRSMDRLVRRKSPEILSILEHESWRGPLLDVGGGAGSLGRAILKTRPTASGVLFDLAEVIRAGRRIHPCPGDWARTLSVAGDFRRHPFASGSFGLVIMSNFLHAYGRKTARDLLAAAVILLRPGGLILIHDYFPDRLGIRPHKGAFYDLNMMLNTYEGACHESRDIVGWLDAVGVKRVVVRDLETDTSVILAGGDVGGGDGIDDPEEWTSVAREIGFVDAAMTTPADIVTAHWPAWKCRFGCKGYGRHRQCPPYAMPVEALRSLLAEYSRAVLVQGSPPGRDFHHRLLALERAAFLKGFPKALAFGAGPCTVCDRCPVDDVCRHPEKARPAMEACGIDVYATAGRVGWPLRPVRDRGDWVTYVGLLLLE